MAQLCVQTALPRSSNSKLRHSAVWFSYCATAQFCDYIAPWRSVTRVLHQCAFWRFNCAVAQFDYKNCSVVQGNIKCDAAPPPGYPRRSQRPWLGKWWPWGRTFGWRHCVIKKRKEKNVPLWCLERRTTTQTIDQQS